MDATAGTARRMSLDGVRTAWWEYGDPDAATTVVMVHGFRGDHHGLEPIVRALDLTGRRVVVPDLPGFGASGAPEGVLDIDAYAGWLRRFVAEIAAPPAPSEPAEGGNTTPGADRRRLVVLGHSFGSIVVAAALAGLPHDDAAAPRLEPERVVLVNPIGAPALSGPKRAMTGLAVAYYRAAAALPARAGFALLRNPAIVRVMSMAMAKTHDRGLRAWIHDQHDRYFSAFDDRRVVLDAFRASVENDVGMFAELIRQPTLLIAADRDDITPLAAQRRLAERMPDARLVVLSGVGHLVHYEAPLRAAGEIEAFLAEPEAPGR